MNDNTHPDALPKLAEGIHKAAEIVAKTMGPKGTNVTIESKLYPFSQTVNDGAVILKSIELSDPLERIGLAHLKQAADRSNNNSGDGSTTTTVLLDAILQEGIKSGVNSIELKKSLDECLPLIEQSIKEQTRQITVDDIPAVARIAGEDEELAQVLGEIYKEIGKDGIIHLENSGTYDTTYSFINGVRFIDTGYLSPYMAYDEQAEKEGRKATKAIYKNPFILITKNKISRIDDIDPLLKVLVAKGEKNLVIFTDDMDSNVARALIELQKNPARQLNILIIKAPTLWKSYVFEDFAAITGATIVEDVSGTSLGTKFKLDYLGTCDTLVCDKEELTIIGTKDYSFHVKQLEEEGTNDAKLRLSWLTTKTAILKLGAKSETELTYRKLKAEDAIFSAKLALKHGIVPGGGIALLNASTTMPDTIGGLILKTSLAQPFLQIAKNAGLDVAVKWDEKNTASIGLDASTGNHVDMFDAGIVDAASIVLGAIRNSLGIASTLLTTSSVITLPPEKPNQPTNPYPF